MLATKVPRSVQCRPSEAEWSDIPSFTWRPWRDSWNSRRPGASRQRSEPIGLQELILKIHRVRMSYHSNARAGATGVCQAHLYWSIFCKHLHCVTICFLDHFGLKWDDVNLLELVYLLFRHVLIGQTLKWALEYRMKGRWVQTNRFSWLIEETSFILRFHFGTTSSLFHAIPFQNFKVQFALPFRDRFFCWLS